MADDEPVYDRFVEAHFTKDRDAAAFTLHSRDALAGEWNQVFRIAMTLDWAIELRAELDAVIIALAQDNAYAMMERMTGGIFKPQALQSADWSQVEKAKGKG